mgnify:FL=1
MTARDEWAAPEDGPRLLFFSGGTALNGISRRLKAYTHNSIHLITPFDSGGSSQVLRRAFDMPAVGDLRSRLMALADEAVEGQAQTYHLFVHRLAKDDPAGAHAEYVTLIDGTHPLLLDVAQPARCVIDRLLAGFDAHMHPGFDLRGASVGNLILAGSYFENGRKLEPALDLMTEMAGVQGFVRTIVDINLEIGAELADGSTVIGGEGGRGPDPTHPPPVSCRARG